jgi:hypothetical protein
LSQERNYSLITMVTGITNQEYGLMHLKVNTTI